MSVRDDDVIEQITVWGEAGVIQKAIAIELKRDLEWRVAVDRLSV